MLGKIMLQKNMLLLDTNVILRYINVYFDKKGVVLYALQVYASTTFDFVDCLLAGYAKEEGHTIFTFDKKLRKYVSLLHNTNH
jgi:predicted nucleic-acid-binding protein